MSQANHKQACLSESTNRPHKTNPTFPAISLFVEVLQRKTDQLNNAEWKIKTKTMSPNAVSVLERLIMRNRIVLQADLLICLPLESRLQNKDVLNPLFAIRENFWPARQASMTNLKKLLHSAIFE